MIHLLWLCFVGYALLVLLVWWRESSMIYLPTRVLDDTPTNWQRQFEDVWLTTSDGIRLHGWLVKSPVGTPSEKPRPVILFFHGNAGNISHRGEKVMILGDLGADVLIVDYRGYGRSAGRPNEQGTYRDADAA